MTESMSKKERLARGSAVIKVMRVRPRAGHFLKSYVDPRRMPKAPSSVGKGLLAEMPWLDVHDAMLQFNPRSAKIAGERVRLKDLSKVCEYTAIEEDLSKLGLPERDIALTWFAYRNWQQTINPLYNPNIAEHFNVLLGLLLSMAKDPDNKNFPDTEAYPCVQFLRGIKTPSGETPHNVTAFIKYLQYVCQKMVDEG